MSNISSILNLFKPDDNVVKLKNIIPQSLFTDIIIKQNDSSTLQELFLQYFTDRSLNINPLQFYHLLLPYLVSNEKILSFLDIIYKAFDHSTKIFSEQLQKSIICNSFNVDIIYDYCNTLEKFITEFNNKYKLNKYLTDGDKVFRTLYKYNIYVNVINKKYQHGDKEYDLYKIIINTLDSSEINELCKFIDLYNSFNNISKLEHFEQVNLKELLKESKLLTDSIIHEYVGILNDKLKELSKYNKENTEEIINKKKETYNLVKNIMSIIKYSGNKDFILEFKNKLRDRLLESKNVFYELNTVKKLDFNDFSSDYIQMVYMVNDIKSSLYMKSLFKKINIKFSSDKYKNTKISYNSLNNMYCKTLREFSWKDKSNFESDNIGRFNEPNELSILLDTYEMFYKKFETHKYRKLKYNYDRSNVTLDVKFGCDRYSIHMTLLQAMVFMLLNENGKMTVQYISDSLKIPIKRLTYVYNSLIATKLINKEVLDEDCKNIQLSVNTSWSYAESYASIAPLVDRVKKIFEEKEKEKEKINMTNIASFIINKLKINKPLNVDELIEHSNYTKDNILNCLNLLIDSNTISTVIHDNNIMYRLNKIDSDLESDSDTEL
jgi:DNA-binding MarR family transcriptional regulator